MKKIILTLSVLFATTFLTSAQENANNQNAPEISFETEVHDFGTIDYASDGTYAFKFTNIGKESLKITDAKGSCGCTVPKWSKEEVAKGQSGYINVSYDTKRQGPFTKTVTVMSNAGKNPTKVLTIKGVVKTQEQTEDQTPFMKPSGVSPMENEKN